MLCAAAAAKSPCSGASEPSQDPCFPARHPKPATCTIVAGSGALGSARTLSWDVWPRQEDISLCSACTLGSILLVAVWHGLYNFVSGTQAATGMLAAVVTTLIMIQGVVLIVLELRARRRGRPSVLGPA